MMFMLLIEHFYWCYRIEHFLPILVNSLNTLESDFASIQHINQAPWGSYQQMAPFSELTSLVAEISSTIHHTRAYVRSVRKLK